MLKDSILYWLYFKSYKLLANLVLHMSNCCIVSFGEEQETISCPNIHHQGVSVPAILALEQCLLLP